MFIHCWWECKLVQSLWKTVVRFKKLEIDMPCHPAIPLLGIYPKDMNMLYQRDTCTTMFIAVLFTIIRITNQPSCLLSDNQVNG